MARIREYIKTIMQRILLPIVYNLSKRKKVDETLVILADAHHDELPYSMWQLRKKLEDEPSFHVMELCKDYQKGSYKEILNHMIQFMRLYANAGYVVICDNYLPVASCRKRPETKVIQLWHSGGALKRFGYDAPGNIPKSYHGGNVFGNYDLITVSAEYAVEPFIRAMRTDENHVKALGISRTDWFYDEQAKADIRARFARECPGAVGKKVVLWAPTFRGSAGSPKLVGEDALEALRGLLPSEYYVMIKLHPHAKREDARSPKMLTEELLVVTDILISDYSSVIYDFAFFGRPMVLFTPDFAEYESQCGFYESFGAIPAYHAMNAVELYYAVLKCESWDESLTRDFWQHAMGACDGHATERVIRWMCKQLLCRAVNG